MATATQYETREYVTVGATGGRMSKVQKFGWIVRDRPGKFSMIDKNDLYVDHEYQRDKVIVQKVRDIQSNWSWAGCGAILVARRPDGTFWVFDGQHRVMAARNRDDIVLLPCLVFDVESKVQEASGFLVANTQRKPVTAIAKFRAMVMTEDAIAVSVDSVLKKLGVVVSDTPRTSREIKCVTNCLKHAANGAAFLEAVLRAAMSIDGDEPASRDLLDGLAWIQRKYELLSDARFMKRLSSMSRADITTAMSRFAAAEGHRGDKVSGLAILQCVNKGLRQKFGDIDD